MTSETTNVADELRRTIPISDSYDRPIHERSLAEIERLQARVEQLSQALRDLAGELEAAYRVFGQAKESAIQTAALVLFNAHVSQTNYPDRANPAGAEGGRHRLT